MKRKFLKFLLICVLVAVGDFNFLTAHAGMPSYVLIAVGGIAVVVLVVSLVLLMCDKKGRSV